VSESSPACSRGDDREDTTDSVNVLVDLISVMMSSTDALDTLFVIAS
jgi:hypothetical protein